MSNLEIQKTSLHRLSCSCIYFVRLDRGSSARFVRLNLSKKEAKRLSWGDLTFQPTNLGRSESLKTALTAHSISVFVQGLPDVKFRGNPGNVGGSWSFTYPGLQTSASHSFPFPSFCPHKGFVACCTVLCLPGKWRERHSDLAFPLQQPVLNHPAER